MNKPIITGLAFFAGLVIGSLVTWYYFKTNYEVISDDESTLLESEDINKDAESNANSNENENKKVELKEYKEIIEQMDYSGYSKKTEEVQEEMINVNKPYLISFDEFGKMEDWNEVQVTYYADDFLVDEDDELITDAEDLFGYDCLKEFDDDDKPDAIYVRNESLETDYEIVYDANKYEDIYNYGYEMD